MVYKQNWCSSDENNVDEDEVVGESVAWWFTYVVVKLRFEKVKNILHVVTIYKVILHVMAMRNTGGQKFQIFLTNYLKLITLSQKYIC